MTTNGTVGAISAVPPFLTFLPQAATPESVATYDSDCTTPKENFEVGDTACAKAEGTLVGTYQIYWVNSQGDAVQTNIISAANPSATWTVSASGNWKAYLSDADSLRALARFSGSDPELAAVDLSVSDTVIATSSFVGDGLITYEVWVLNNGPDAAANVSLIQTVPNNSVRETQVSVQDSGPTFGCVDSAINTTCTIASLASGASAYFTFIYKVISGVPVGTLISNTATVASDASELHAPDNVANTAMPVAAGAPAATCTLDCPSNITTVANTTFNGNPGANVIFSSAEGIGSCGEISTSSPSGSFFPVGTTSVVVTSTTGVGCSFDVTVVTEGAPTIACPPNQTVTAAANSSSATLNPGTPVTSPSTGVSVAGVRSDSEELTEPYPVGTTFITWTVTDAAGLTGTCSQRVVVNSDGCGTDTENPTITAPDDVSITTPLNTLGSCGFVVGESQLGTANANDNCSVNVTRTGVPSGNFFPVGSTTITYTATDAAGNSATATQVVNVTDGSQPVIEAPADASYVCLSEVPAANVSQATRGDVLDENGNVLPPGPPIDNCGTPTVTVTETTTGAGSASSPLIITRTFTATDAASNSASDNQVITVVDPTLPTITAPAAAVFQCVSEIPAANPADATAADNCAGPTVTVSDSSNGGAGSSASPLIITRTFTATDAVGNTASDSQTITVVDSTAPTVSAPADANYQCASNVPAANAADATASDNCGIPTVNVSETTNGGNGSIASPLIITRTYTAADAVGNSAADSQTITVIDNTPPVISCPTNIVMQLPLNSPATSLAVSYPAPTATDNCSSPAVTTDIASGSVFPVGTTTITASATDDKNNSSSCQFTVTVLYNFTGFFSPVSNVPTINNVNAGRSIPLKFSLSGNKGLGIFAAGYPASQQIACDSSAPLADLEGIVTTGGSTLTYSPDQYHYNWKTENSWAGTCRKLVVRLNDGSDHIALFQFR